MLKGAVAKTHTNFDTMLERDNISKALSYIPQKQRRPILSRLDRLSQCGITEFSLNPDVCGGYDRLLEVNVGYYSKSKAKQSNIVAIAYNSSTKQILAHSLPEYLSYGKKPDNIKQIVAGTYSIRINPVHFRRNKVSLKPFSTSIYRMTSFHDVEMILSRTIQNSTTKFRKDVKTFFRHNKGRINGKSDFKQDIVKDAYEHLAGIKKSTLEILDKELCNNTAYKWAAEIVRKSDKAVRSEPCEQLTVYNHIVNTASPEAQRHRYNALRTFLPFRNLFLEKDLWDDIDAGIPAYNALASNIGVKPATIRNMAKMLPEYNVSINAMEYAKFLDIVDFSRWPKDYKQYTYFKSFMNSAEMIKEYSGAPLKRTVEESIRKHRDKIFKNGTLDWDELFFQSQIKSVHGAMKTFKRYHGRLFTPSEAKRMPAKEIPKEPESFSSLPGVLRSPNSVLRKQTLQEFSNRISQIDDMKKDIKKKIILPAVILCLEEQGYRYCSDNAFDDLLNEIQKEVWDQVRIKKQLKISDYWHSKRVNIRNRFRSAVITNSEFNEWKSIINEPLALPNGVVAHPLTSSADLDDETEAMSSENVKCCVWSYADSCATGKLHVFSLRTDRGGRLSTLGLRENSSNDGKIHLKEFQNHARGNSTPAKGCKEASAQIIDLFNKGVISPDWDAINHQRAIYKAREADNKIGYNFRSKKDRDAVFAVYKPCMSKKGRQSFDTFIDEHAIRNRVREFISKCNSNQTPLYRVIGPMPLGQ